jgi:hypothetical protein
VALTVCLFVCLLDPDLVEEKMNNLENKLDWTDTETYENVSVACNLEPVWKVPTKGTQPN